MDNLYILLLMPVLGAIFLAFIKNPGVAKSLALTTALISLALTIPFLLNFVPDASMQFEQSFEWLPSYGIHFHIGLDGISLPLVLLTNTLLPLIILASFKNTYGGGFYALVLFMQAGLLLVFTALDAFLFYVGWEIALIPIYFICALWGDENRIRVNMKFFVYTFLGSLIMLVAIIYLHLQVPERNFELLSFYSLNLSSQAQGWVFLAFFAAFAVKMPIFPLHTWQPDTYTSAPTAGTMLLSGIMLKMGVYGLIRWLIPVSPLGFGQYGMLCFILAITGIVYASVIALKQQNIKRLIAYSSIAHVGLIGAGVFAWNLEGVQGAMLQMINHGINVVGLFFVAEIILRRTTLLSMENLGGIAKPAPKLAIVFLVIIMASVGLPLTNGFIGEFLLLIGVYQHGLVYALLAGLTLILGAAYMLRLFQKTMLGTTNSTTEAFRDIHGSEMIVFAVLIVLIIIIGVHPQPLLNLSEAAVQNLIKQVSLN
jgi:NADH-quinone oxidoreductase subunit M